MFCPRCGQEQLSIELRFCSRCGFPMAGVASLVASGGEASLPGAAPKTESPRRRGVKQGAFIFMLSFLIVPIISMITVWTHAEPFAVSIAAVVLTMGGMLRMAYAWMFEESSPRSAMPGKASAGFNESLGAGSAGAGALPPMTSVPASDFVAPNRNWRDTNDLQPAASVTDPTTKLLKEE